MVITNDTKIPSCQQLEAKVEINLSSATLMSAAPYVGKQCEDINNEFMLCRLESQDPSACISLGHRVTNCALSVFQMIKRECRDEFYQYVNCIDKSSGDYCFRHCRNTQVVFDECMDDKLCLKRPDFGYFCRPRVHRTISAPPQLPKCPCSPAVPDPTPNLPDCRERKPPRFGARLYWSNE